MSTNGYRYADLAKMAADLRARRVSAAELAAAAIGLLDDVGRRHNAVANLLPERTMREARASDRRRRTASPRSPLDGIPYGVKDLLAAKGAPTTWGAPHFRDQVFTRDASVISRLARSGGVLAAKLALVQLAGGGRPSRPGASLHGQGRNAWDADRYSGGSSSGPAIAVSAGLLPYALGSETGGSIQSPSAFSGVTGIRPTYGLVSRDGAMALSWTLDKVGVLARSATDCATVLEVIGRADASDPTSARRRFRALDASGARRVLRRARVAYAGTDVDEAAPHMRARLAQGIDEFERVAPRFVTAAIRDDLPYAAILETVMLAEAATIFAEHLTARRFDLVDAAQKEALRSGLRISARDYLTAMRLRTEVMRSFTAVFERADVILSVGRTSTAPRLDAPNEKRTTATVPDRLRAAANLAGLPGIFFPCGLADDGMPVGLQLVGPPFSEPLLVALAAAYQRSTGHHLLRPAAS